MNPLRGAAERPVDELSPKFRPGAPLRPPLPCCRCGRRPRDLEQSQYLCGWCLDSPVAMQEVEELLSMGTSIAAMRFRAILEFAWAGGWNRKL